LLGDQPALAPEESFYQRILADDPDEASHLAEEFLKENSLSAYYDQIAIRGLALAQSDVSRGMLDHDQLRTPIFGPSFDRLRPSQYQRRPEATA
jgi:hypothetical protein